MRSDNHTPHKDNANHEEDDLPIPAGPYRVVLGLVLMVLGVTTAMGVLGGGPWLSVVGWAVFISSFLVMTKSSVKKTELPPTQN